MEGLKKVLLRGFESKDLDYKGPMSWNENDKKACCEIVKDIMGLANTLGGFLIIGVSENTTGFVWKGLTEEQAASFETTRLNRFLQNYTDPPINAQLKKVEHEDRSYVIIEVPRFSDTPHICQKEYPGILISPQIYVRTDNNETAPLKDSSDFRTIIEHAIRNRSDALLGSIRTILMGSPVSQQPNAKEKFTEQIKDAIAAFTRKNPLKQKNYTGYREVSFFPARYDHNRYTLEKLKQAAKDASVDFKGWPFLFVSNNIHETYSIQDGIETLVAFPDFVGNDRVDFWRLQTSGVFYLRLLMEEESYFQRSGQPPGLYIDQTAIFVAEAVNCLCHLYRALDSADDERITLRFRILGTEGRRLVSTRGPLSQSYICQIPEIIHERDFSLAEWAAGLVDLSVEICKEVYHRFNWDNPNLGSTRTVITKLLARQI